MEMTAQINCNDRLCQWILKSLEETVGEEEIKAIAIAANVSAEPHIQTKDSMIQAKQLFAALENVFGEPGGKGLSIQAGRNAFNVLLQENGEELGWFSQRFRLLPKNSRIQEGLNTLMNQLSDLCGTNVSVQEDEINWSWVADGCVWREMSREGMDMCYFSQGLLQEFMLWASGGRVHLVNIASCALLGDETCKLLIRKQPLEG